jgi:hypothetical protein
VIDTFKVKLPLTPIILLAIQNKRTTETTRKELGIRMYAPLIVPPLNKTLTVMRDYEYPIGTPNMCFYVEGSLPKLEYGENVRLLYPYQIVSLLKRIEMALIEQYGDVPPWEEWEIQRIDPCYAWKFNNGEELKVLEYLKTLDYPQKNKHLYKTGVVWGGRSFSPKFYLKEPEFMLNDYKELNENNPSHAREIQELSKGILRYEVKLNKAKLRTLLNKDKEIITGKEFASLDLNWYYKVLNDCLSEVLKNTNKVSFSDEDSLRSLTITHGQQKGNRLFIFWKVLPLIRQLIKKMYNSTTISRNQKDISLAGVGVPHLDNVLPFDLSIPSKNVVNSIVSDSIASAMEHDD